MYRRHTTERGINMLNIFDVNFVNDLISYLTKGECRNCNKKIDDIETEYGKLEICKDCFKLYKNGQDIFMKPIRY